MRRTPLRSRRGATLIELMITVGVYTFIVLSLFAITRDGTLGWKAVDTRTTVQTQLRNFEKDIMTELKRTSLATIRIYGMSSGNSYVRAISFKSAMNQPTTAGTMTDPSGTPLLAPQIFFVDTSVDPPKPSWQRYVLYYLTRPNKDWHSQAYGLTCKSYESGFATASEPDHYCPHKWIVRKDIYLSANLNDKSKLAPSSGYVEAIGSEPTEADVSFGYLPSGSGGPVRRARVIAKDILSLSFNVKGEDGSSLSTPLDSKGAPKGPIILFDVKAYKSIEAQGARIRSIGQEPLTSDTYQMDAGSYTGTPTPKFDQYTVQLDNRVVPMNP